MRPRMLVVLLLFACSPGPSMASGLNLRWNDCAQDGGVTNRYFACDSNSGTSALVASVALDTDLFQVNGVEVRLRLAYPRTTGLSFPAWWMLQGPAACRTGAITMSWHEGVLCLDMFPSWVGQFVVDQQRMELGSDLIYDYGHLVSVRAVQSAYVVDLYAGQEYALARWIISNRGTVGGGSCSGCREPMLLLLARAQVWYGSEYLDLTQSTEPWSNLACWQTDDCRTYIVPTRTTTWGAIKSLYR